MKKSTWAVLIVFIVLIVSVFVFFALVGSGKILSRADIPEDIKPSIDEIIKKIDFNPLLNIQNKRVNFKYRVFDTKGNLVNVDNLFPSTEKILKFDPDVIFTVDLNFDVYYQSNLIGSYTYTAKYLPRVSFVLHERKSDDSNEDFASVNYPDPEVYLGGSINCTGYDRYGGAYQVKCKSGQIKPPKNQLSGVVGFDQIPPFAKKVKLGPITLPKEDTFTFDLQMPEIPLLYGCGIQQGYQLNFTKGGDLSSSLIDESKLAESDRKCGDHQQRLDVMLGPNIEPDQDSVEYAFEISMCNNKKSYQGSIKNGEIKTFGDLFDFCNNQYSQPIQTQTQTSLPTSQPTGQSAQATPTSVPTQIAQATPTYTYTPPAAYPTSYPGAQATATTVPMPYEPMMASINEPTFYPEISYDPAGWANTQTDTFMQENTWMPTFVEPVVAAVYNIYAGMYSTWQMMGF